MLPSPFRPSLPATDQAALALQAKAMQDVESKEQYRLLEETRKAVSALLTVTGGRLDFEERWAGDEMSTSSQEFSMTTIRRLGSQELDDESLTSQEMSTSQEFDL